jgi:hypothetical protein
MRDAGSIQFRLFKRPKVKSHVYYARLLDPETGRVRKTVSTGITNKTRSAEWAVNYLAEERERSQRERDGISPTVIELRGPTCRNGEFRGGLVSEHVHGHAAQQLACTVNSGQRHHS